MTAKTLTRPPRPAEQLRRAELAQIHIAKKQLALSDDDYRALLTSVTGQDSASALDWRGRKALLDHFKKLGFKASAPRKPNKQNGSGLVARADGKAAQKEGYSKQQRLIFVLWSQLHALGVVRSNTELALNAWIKRETGIDHLKWLNPVQASSTIDKLKAWGREQGVALSTTRTERPEFIHQASK